SSMIEQQRQHRPPAPSSPEAAAATRVATYFADGAGEDRRDQLPRTAPAAASTAPRSDSGAIDSSTAAACRARSSTARIGPTARAPNLVAKRRRFPKKPAVTT